MTNGIGGFMTFVFGAVVGAAAIMLSRREDRAKMRKTYDDLRHRAQQTMRRSTQQINELGGRASKQARQTGK